MTKGDYLRKCGNRELAAAFAATVVILCEKMLSLFGIDASEIITKELQAELLDDLEKELGEELCVEQATTREKLPARETPTREEATHP